MFLNVSGLLFLELSNYLIDTFSNFKAESACQSADPVR